MSTSPILGLTLMTASQAQKEVVFNEFLIAMDALFRGSVLDGSLHIPPSAPAEGDAYIINTGATGLWSGYDNQIAFYFNGWQFVSPPTKITLFDVAANQFYQFQGGTLLGMTFLWDAVPVSTVTVLTDLADVSITSPTNGEVMTYNSSTSKWNAMAAAFTATLASLTDVEVTEGSAIDGFVLYWKDADSKWEAKALAAPPTFLTLPDVSLTGVANGFLLEYTTTGPGVKFVDPLSLILVASLANVGDVTYGSGLTVGEVLQWNGAAWTPVILSTLTLAGLSDVLVTEGSGIDGCPLVWNETAVKWVPGSPTAGATTLAALTDVNVTEGSGLNGKVLYWKNADTKWEAEAIAAVALSGAYADLSGTPSIPGNSSFNLSGLGDVTITSLANGQVPTWNSTASKWENATPSGGGGGGSSTLAGDSDVTITSPSNGQVLTYNSGASKWENAAPSGGGGGGSGTLAGDSDVAISLPADGQVLQYNATASAWENVTPSVGGALLPPQYEMGPFAPPAPSWFTALNGSGVTTTATAITGQGTKIYATGLGGGSSGSGFMVKSISGWTTPWTLTTRFVPSNITGSYPGYGLSVIDTTGAMITWQVTGDGAGRSRIGVDRWNSLTSYNTGGPSSECTPSPTWMRVRNDGTNFYFGFSYDGQIWAEASLPVSDLGTLSEVGIGGSMYGASSSFTQTSAGLICTYWDDQDHPYTDHEALTSATLTSLADVNVTEGAGIDGYYLKWHEATGKWIAGAGSGAVGSSTLAGDSDVAITGTPANNQILAFNTTAGYWINQNAPLSIAISITGLMVGDEILLQYLFPYAATFTAGLSGSFAKANTAATGSTVVTMKKNGTAIGTVTWAASATSGTFAFAANVSFAAGDVLQLVAPATADATLSDAGVTLLGARS